jgi:hypothetical protein
MILKAIVAAACWTAAFPLSGLHLELELELEPLEGGRHWL